MIFSNPAVPLQGLLMSYSDSAKTCSLFLRGSAERRRAYHVDQIGSEGWFGRVGLTVTPLVHGYRMRGAGKAMAEALLQFAAPHWHRYP